MTNLKKITYVCYANFCRSPVAERISERFFLDRYVSQSAGTNPMILPRMDERSERYLLNRGYSTALHTPKKINTTLIEESEYIFALDIAVLMDLNRQFTKYTHKIKLLNYLSPQVDLSDPYKLKNNQYDAIMMNIEKEIEKLSLSI